MKESRIGLNYLYKLMYELLVIITPLITAPYVSRVLNPDGIGIYSFTQSSVTYFSLFAALGTISYGTREIAQHRNNKNEASKLFWEIEILTIGTTLVSLLCFLVLILISSKHQIYYIAWIPQLIAVGADISWFYTGYEKIGYTVLWNSICKILGVVLIFSLVHSQADLIRYIFIMSGTVLLGNLSMWIHLRGMLVPVDYHEFSFKNHLKETMIYFIPAVATTIYTVLDKTLIGLITKNDYENGYYEQSTKIINMCKALAFSAVNSVMGARMSYLFAQEEYQEIKERLDKSMNFILFLSFGIVGGLIAVAGNFIPLFFGSEYYPVISFLYWMSPLIIIIGVSNCLGAQYFTPSGQRKRSAKIIVIGALVNLIFNIILIPKLQGTGAVIGSIIAELFISVLYVHYSNGYMSFKQIFKISYKRVIAALVMCIIVMAVGKGLVAPIWLTLVIQVLVGVCVYIIILFVLRDSIVKEALQIMDRLINRYRNKG